MNAITKTELQQLAPAAEVKIKLDGREVCAREGETLLTVADREGCTVPRLCHADGLTPAGNCRSCVVEVAGERTLAASCCRTVAAGMEVQTASPRARSAQRMVVELLLADTAAAELPPGNELTQWAQTLGVGRFAEGAQGSTAAAGLQRLQPRPAHEPDGSHAAILFNADACIQCTRCLRACRDEQMNDVIGLALRGHEAKIIFDQADAMGASSCVGCGECVQACPTGALSSKALLAVPEARVAPDKVVDSLCPYCGVGCQVSYAVKDERIVDVQGRDGPANEGRLCVKGRYGYDYARSPQRLSVPLVRREGVPKVPGQVLAPDEVMKVFREASWEEALALAGGGLKRLRDQHGATALAGFGSAKGSNEEAYLFQKLVRLGFGSNNVDHCTRLCHASSVAALLEGLGSGAVSNPVRDVINAEVVVIIGANPTVNHPVAATWIKNAAERGTKLILLDPRQNALTRHAHRHLQFKPGGDVALLNAMMHVIVTEGLTDPAFIAKRTEGFERLAAHLQAYSPEAMSPHCGIAPEAIREVARLYATSRGSMILWGMGVSQHVHGTDNARCLIGLALMTGQIGRPGTGLHPLRGQNNVQGASDAGLIPMMYPDYKRVADPKARDAIAAVWGVPSSRLSLQPGLTVVEVMHAAAAGTLKGLYVMGENPAMSDPDANHAREALAALDLLVVQDIFMTETACLADVVLPASAFAEKTGSFTNTDRTVQLARAALSPPGQARQDIAIIIDMARELGLDWSGYGDVHADPARVVGAVFEEMRQAIPNIAGISWERLQREDAVTYPCADESDPGQPVVFTERFPTPSGRGRFVAAALLPSAEEPDLEYPLVLCTGRQLEHWHTGSMTRRSQVLDAIEPEPVAWMHPEDLARTGVAPGEPVTLTTRRGSVALYARADDQAQPGMVFVAFCWAEAAVNELTHPGLDPVAKIPGFKVCAVKATAGGTVKVNVQSDRAAAGADQA